MYFRKLAFFPSNASINLLIHSTARNQKTVWRLLSKDPNGGNQFEKEFVMSNRKALLGALVAAATTLSMVNVAAAAALVDADTNKDGRVTEAEWVGYGAGKKDHPKFADVDTDKSGDISTDEFIAAMKKS